VVERERVGDRDCDDSSGQLRVGIDRRVPLGSRETVVNPSKDFGAVHLAAVLGSLHVHGRAVLGSLVGVDGRRDLHAGRKSCQSDALCGVFHTSVLFGATVEATACGTSPTEKHLELS
jgi:hypothetical protein